MRGPGVSINRIKSPHEIMIKSLHGININLPNSTTEVTILNILSIGILNTEQHNYGCSGVSFDKLKKNQLCNSHPSNSNF